MNKIDSLIYDFICEFNYKPLISMFENINSGKKLRSKLLLEIAGENEKTLNLCAIIELIHMASLLHDDVIDQSDLRRGKPSINAVFGSKNAIMMGDILYSKGYFELCNFDKFIQKTISKAVSHLSLGELMDVKMSENFNHNKNEYMKMIYYKTAILIEATAICGAFLSGFNTEKFAIYGKNLGLAFQIIDDILDITQDSKTLGKPELSDFKDGKTTLPYIYLYDSLNLSNKEKLKSLFKKELIGDEVLWIKDMFKEYEIVEKCIREAKNLGAQALDSIKEYNNENLIHIVNNMIDREF